MARDVFGHTSIALVTPPTATVASRMHPSKTLATMNREQWAWAFLAATTEEMR
jgi:hypothetical protein